MNARKWVNIQGDREFQAISQYIIAFLNKVIYSDQKFKKLTLITVTTPSLWESGHDGAFIAVNLFW